MAATRSQTKVYLLDEYIEEIVGGKLPSLRQVFGRFLYLHLEKKLTIRQASATVIKETTVFWNKARIPMKDFQNCQSKIEKIFEQWRLLKKNKSRASATQKANENAFAKKLDDLFDLAHENALAMITIGEDRMFLLAQREKGRTGCMAGLDKQLHEKEKRSADRKATMSMRRQRMEEMRERSEETVTFDDSSSSSGDEVNVKQPDAAEVEFESQSQRENEEEKLL